MASVLNISGFDHRQFSAAEDRAKREPVQLEKIAALELIPDTVFHVNERGIIFEFKPSEQYSPSMVYADTEGRTIDTILPSHAGTLVKAAIAEALETGEVQTFEYCVELADKNFYFEARVMRTGVVSALVIVRDTSEWQRYEDCDMLLLEIASKVHLERNLDEIIQMVCEKIMTIFGLRLLFIAYKNGDNAAKLIAANKELACFLQGDNWGLIEGDGLVGSTLRTGKFQLMDIEDQRMVAWRERLEEYSVTTGAAFPLKVGGLVLGALTLFSDDPDFWKKRTIVQLTNIAAQVALVMHETANRQRLKILTTGLESAGNAIVIASRNGHLQWVNKAFLELNGYSVTEVIGRNIRIFDLSQHTRKFFRALRQHILAGKIWQGEIINRRKDNSQYIAEMTITPVRDEIGKITNFITITQDITQRKQAEDEILEAREMIARAERLSALGIMTAGIAHEINQPLNALKVVAEGMLYWHSKGKLPQNDIAEIMKNIEDIAKDADRIDAIIKHMTSFIHNIESVEPVPCDINEVINGALAILGPQLLFCNITIVTDLADKLPRILGNSTQLEQVVINLLVNAIHALQEADQLDKEIGITTGYEKNQLCISICDNGPGINKVIKDKIFDPFFTTKSVGRGMGLGLSVVHLIVTSYGGRIGVKDNHSGRGANFWLEFPLATDNRKGGGVV